MYKRIIFILLVLVLFLQFNNNIYSDTIARKDPFLAGVLSWFMPGLGQFYAGDYFCIYVGHYVNNSTSIFVANCSQSFC